MTKATLIGCRLFCFFLCNILQTTDRRSCFTNTSDNFFDFIKSFLTLITNATYDVNSLILI